MSGMFFRKGKQTLLVFILFASPIMSDAASSLDSVQQSINEGNFSQALSESEKILSSDPSNLQALFFKSTALIHLNKLSDANNVLEKLLKLKSDSPEIYNNLATVYANQGEHKKAAELLDKALATDPRYATIYQNLTKIYAKLAGMAYRRALESETPADSDKIALETIAKLAAPPEPQVMVAEQVAVDSPKVAATPVNNDVVTEKNPSTPDEAIKSVLAWAKAWSDQDVDAYLSHYSDSFRTPDNLSFADWSAQRRDRLKAPKFIRVQIKQPEAILLEEGSLANVSFYQDYTSNTFNETVKKILILKWKSGKWLILLEQVGV